jgi:hypothetical protein
MLNCGGGKSHSHYAKYQLHARPAVHPPATRPADVLHLRKRSWRSVQRWQSRAALAALLQGQLPADTFTEPPIPVDAFARVAPDLRRRIRLGHAVDLPRLLPATDRSPWTILSWIKAFTLYVGVRASFHPEDTVPMLTHMIEA